MRAPEGSSLESTKTILESIATRDPGDPRRRGDAPHDRRRPAADTQNLGVGLRRSSRRSRSARRRPVRDHGPGPHGGPAAVRAAAPPRAGAAGRGLRRRATTPRSSSGSAAPTSSSSRSTRTSCWQTLKTIPGVGRRDTNLDRRQARARGADRPRQGGRPRRAASQDVASTLNVLVGGQKVTDYYEGGEQYEVHAAGRRPRPARRRRASPRPRCPSATRAPCRSRDVVTLEEGTGPSLVNRHRAGSGRSCSPRTCSPATRRRRSSTRLTQAATGAEDAAGLHLGLHRPLARAGQGGAQLRDRLRASRSSSCT